MAIVTFSDTAVVPVLYEKAARGKNTELVPTPFTITTSKEHYEVNE